MLRTSLSVNQINAVHILSGLKESCYVIPQKEAIFTDYRQLYCIL